MPRPKGPGAPDAGGGGGGRETWRPDCGGGSEEVGEPMEGAVRPRSVTLAFGTEAAGRGAGAAASAGSGVADLRGLVGLVVEDAGRFARLVEDVRRLVFLVPVHVDRGARVGVRGLGHRGGRGRRDARRPGGAAQAERRPAVAFCREGGGGGMRDGEVGAGTSRRRCHAEERALAVHRHGSAGGRRRRRRKRFARRSGGTVGAFFPRPSKMSRLRSALFVLVPWHESPACAAHRGYHGGQ